MSEFLSTLQTAWLLGGVAVGIWHEWWRKRVPHAGESAWRSRIGEELVYIGSEASFWSDSSDGCWGTLRHPTHPTTTLAKCIPHVLCAY